MSSALLRHDRTYFWWDSPIGALARRCHTHHNRRSIFCRHHCRFGVGAGPAVTEVARVALSCAPDFGASRERCAGRCSMSASSRRTRRRINLTSRSCRRQKMPRPASSRGLFCNKDTAKTLSDLATNPFCLPQSQCRSRTAGAYWGTSRSVLAWREFGPGQAAHPQEPISRAPVGLVPRFTIRTAPALIAKSAARKEYCDSERSFSAAIKRIIKKKRVA